MDDGLDVVCGCGLEDVIAGCMTTDLRSSIGVEEGKVDQEARI